MEYKDPGRYIPIIYLLYSWGSLSGVPSRVPLYLRRSLNYLSGVYRGLDWGIFKGLCRGLLRV